MNLFSGLVNGEEFTMVAVKMLKEEATDDLIRDFEREASLLAEFEHPNIVKLLGVCAIGKPMCLLFEFMSKGDLNAYLRSCSPSNYIVRCNGGSTTSSTFSDVKISHIEQVTISKQITTGMIYLSGVYSCFKFKSTKHIFFRLLYNNTLKNSAILL